MSTAPSPQSPVVPRSVPAQDRGDRASLVRHREAAVRRRIVLATDALAVVDLLLGVHASLRSIGGNPPESGE